ncbi:hypothetical protein BJ742DRAFT_812683 [Cladochytrium replicatum]|nr:hypothetical protein BJ742DRAFT_812683 [Cladochytrium replicatum]
MIRWTNLDFRHVAKKRFVTQTRRIGTKSTNEGSHRPLIFTKKTRAGTCNEGDLVILLGVCDRQDQHVGYVNVYSRDIGIDSLAHFGSENQLFWPRQIMRQTSELLDQVVLRWAERIASRRGVSTALAATTGARPPRVHFHVFSNEGAFMYAMLVSLLQRKLRSAPNPSPYSSLWSCLSNSSSHVIFDSSPAPIAPEILTRTLLNSPLRLVKTLKTLGLKPIITPLFDKIFKLYLKLPMVEPHVKALHRALTLVPQGPKYHFLYALDDTIVEPGVIEFYAAWLAHRDASQNDAGAGVVTKHSFPSLRDITAVEDDYCSVVGGIFLEESGR